MNNQIINLLIGALLACASAFACANKLTPFEANESEKKLSFRDLPVLDSAFIDLSPANRNDGLKVGALTIASSDKDKIIALAKELASGKHGKYDSLLIAHKDKLLFESYYKRGRINLPHPLASSVKGFTSLALGRAIQLGYLKMADLDKPLVSFLSKLDKTKLVSGAEKITLHKALTMHGGLTIDRKQWEALEKSTPEILKGQGLVQTLLTNSAPITDKTQKYLYGNFNPLLVMSVIDAVVPGTAQEFINQEILQKLGINDYQWDDHISGLPEAGWLVSMTSRDMLKWGQLVLNNGKWNGEQLISAEYLAKATSGLVDPTEDWIDESYRYGYFWYQAPIKVTDKKVDATFAWGGGGQRVIVVKDLELTIVITGHDRDDKIMQQINSVILPAFAQS